MTSPDWDAPTPHGDGPDGPVQPLDPAMLAEVLAGLSDTARAHEAALTELGQQQASVLDLLEQTMAGTPDGPWTWRSISLDRRRELLQELRTWIDWAIVRYDLRGVHAIRPCWHRHTVAVEELTGAYVAWLAVYSGAQRQPHDGLIAWHDRWWWPCLRRLTELGVFNQCHAGHHEPGDPYPPTDAEDFTQMLHDLEGPTRPSTAAPTTTPPLPVESELS